MFARLKALKVEMGIDLQLLMDKAKVKLQKEFEAWWAKEATSLQVLAAAPSLPQESASLQPGDWQAAREGLNMQPSPGGGGRGKRMRGLDPHQTHSLPLPPEVSAQSNKDGVVRVSLTQGRVGVGGGGVHSSPKLGDLPLSLPVMEDNNT